MGGLTRLIIGLRLCVGQTVRISAGERGRLAVELAAGARQMGVGDMQRFSARLVARQRVRKVADDPVLQRAGADRRFLAPGLGLFDTPWFWSKIGNVMPASPKPILLVPVSYV